MNLQIEILNSWGSRFTGFALPMLLQSGILIALLLAANRLLRRKVRATVRYALWMLVLVKLLLPPSLTSPTSLAYWFPASVSQQPALSDTTQGQRTTATAVEAGQIGSPDQPVAASPSLRPAFTWQALLLGVWLAGFVSLAAWVCRRSLSVRRLLKETSEAPARLGELLKSCCQQLGIARPISLRLAATAGSPAICGYFRPVILIPPALPETLTDSEMRSVLLHELAHHRRGDLWISHAQILLQLFYWYNPLLWLANSAIRRVREQAVDESVLVETKDETGSYATTLLQVARLAVARPALSIGRVGILEPASGLKERIHQILHRPVPRTARVGVRATLMVTLTALVLLPMACKKQAAADPANRSADITRSESLGFKLNAEQARELEAKVKAAPEDDSLRAELLGYYMKAQFESATAREARQSHILWLIEHRPETQIDGPLLGLNPIMDGAAYDKGKTLWLKQVEGHPENLAVLDHAANYLLLADRAKAEALWKKAQSLDPDNPHWSDRLAHLYALGLSRAGTNATPTAVKALSEMENAQAETTKDKFSNLKYLAKMAFAAGELEKARGYATDLLQQAPQHPKSYDYGNAIYYGNMILGRVAVREGRLDDAGRLLLAAGKTPGSPQLNSFGPNMSLAKDLLEKGDKTTVLAYFKECRAFWKMGGSKLDEWTKAVTEGRIPDFRANLDY